MSLKKWISENILNSNNNLISPRVQGAWIKNNFLSQYSRILEKTSFLKDVSLSERIYCVMNDFRVRPVCKCGSEVEFIKYSMGYRKYCSSECQKEDVAYINEKKARSFKKTCQEKYGVDNVFRLEEVKDKIKETCVEKYGVDNSFKNSEVREKQKQTMIDRYGVSHNMKSEDLKDKIREKYGGILPLHSEESKDKIQETFEQKYGGRFGASAQIREKIKKTMLERYGVDHPCKSKELMQKRKEAWEKKYESGHPSRKHMSKEVYDKLSNPQWLKHQHHDLKKPCMVISLELGLNPNSVNHYMKKNGIEIMNYLNSYPEQEIVDFIDQECVRNSRNIIPPLELDIYVPEHDLAIEYDGLFWHSYGEKKEGVEEKRKHLFKTDKCREKGIQLLHIFENEWINPVQQDIWKSMISSKMRRNDRVFARKCKIREISDTKVIRDFLVSNHLQGFAGSSVKLGLFHQEDLVSLMTFGKTRYSKKYEWEMIRFCNKKYLNVIGGPSKMFKYFVNNYHPKSVISYADLRHSDGNMYDKLSFKLSHLSDPNYFYFKYPDMTLYPRIKFQKHKLHKVLEVFDPNLSEVENVYANGYRRIWDCGNMIYVWND